MAKFEIKFFDNFSKGTYLMVSAFNSKNGDSDEKNDIISINGLTDEGNDICVWFDKSTAIKFAKTLRTEINKITESEVNNI